MLQRGATIAVDARVTIAGYWHLKGGMTKPPWIGIAISRGIALFEYCLAEPARSSA